MLDAEDGLTTQDEHVAGYALEEGAGLVIAINKWDLVEKDEDTFDEYVAEIRQKAPFLDFAPVSRSAPRPDSASGRVLEAAVEIAAERRRRVADRGAQRLAARGNLPPSGANCPWPPVALLLRHPGGHRAAHVRALRQWRSGDPLQLRRYLENRLREAFGFAGTPIRLIIRERARDDVEPRPVRRARARRRPERTKSGTGGNGKSGAGKGWRHAAWQRPQPQRFRPR